MPPNTMRRRLIVAGLFALGIGPLYAAPLRCDAPGVAQFVVTDMLSKNPSAQKLGLKVISVRIVAVEDTGSRPDCIVAVQTNQGISLRYRFRFDAEGGASLDLIP